MTLRRAFADDRGSSEVVATIVIAPILVAFVALVFYVGRQVDTRSTVRAAAEAAAQAAARQRDPASADTKARQVVASVLTDEHSTCLGGPTTTVDLSGFRPGGVVTVTVTCTVDRSDLGGLAPPERAFTGTSTAVVDTYRATTGPQP